MRVHKKFRSKIRKKRDCYPNVISDCSNQRKYEKVIQNGLQWVTQNPSKITENQFWSHLSASLHPMVTKIMKKWCHKTQNAWKMVPQDFKKSINLWNEINEICLKRYYMQLLKFSMISILPICIFSINRTANRETTDCWRGRRQGRSLRNIYSSGWQSFPTY